MTVSNSTVVQSWLFGKQAHSANMHTDGNTVWSYSMPIATISRKRDIVLTREWFELPSHTTRMHMRYIDWHVHTQISVPDKLVKEYVSGNWEYLGEYKTVNKTPALKSVDMAFHLFADTLGCVLVTNICGIEAFRLDKIFNSPVKAVQYFTHGKPELFIGYHILVPADMTMTTFDDLEQKDWTTPYYCTKAKRYGDTLLVRGTIRNRRHYHYIRMTKIDTSWLVPVNGTCIDV